MDRSSVSIFLLSNLNPHPRLACSYPLVYACYLYCWIRRFLMKQCLAHIIFFAIFNPCSKHNASLYQMEVEWEPKKKRRSCFPAPKSRAPSTPYDCSTTRISPVPLCFINLSNGFSELPLSLVSPPQRATSICPMHVDNRVTRATRQGQVHNPSDVI